MSGLRREPGTPPSADAAQWRAKGNDALAKGLLPEAAACYRRAVQTDPSDAAARVNLGYALLEQGMPAEAAVALEPAVTLAHELPGLAADAHFLLGRALQAQGRYAAAVDSYRAALAARPAFNEALQELAPLLIEEGRAQEALACLDRLMQAQGRAPDALANYSAALLRLDRPEEALRHAEEALRAQPGHRASLHNKSWALLELLRLEEAQQLLLEATRLYPEDPDLRWNLALAHLLLGELVPGWEAHEARWAARGFVASTHVAPLTDRPRWTGAEALEGRSILLHAEQGLGDTIQFLRYVPLVASRAKQVLLHVPPAVAPLLGKLPANCRVLAGNEAVARPDLQCPLLSLPRAFRTALAEVPANVPYLHADAARAAAWADRLPGTGKLRVGIAWSGNPRHRNDRNRSIPLETFRAVAADAVQFVALQPDVRAADRNALAGWSGLFDAGPQLADFAETAALLSVLDLVVSVDTSVAHLAGALGRPVWILLPYFPDWRWLLEREDSPWYPTARLFRQPSRGDWSAVLQRVRGQLRTLRPL